MTRVYRFSTQGGASVANAALALDSTVDFVPLADLLMARHPEAAVWSQGHVWGLQLGSKLLRSRPAIAPGDVGARIQVIEGVPSVRWLYEVAAVEEGPELLDRLGIAWKGGTWPVTVLFAPRTELATPVAYAALRSDLGWQAPGGNWEALWAPVGLSTLTSYAHALVVENASPVSSAERILMIALERSAGKAQQQRTRPGQARFRAAVLSKYGAHCGACNVEGRLLDAAHLVDEGFSEDSWEIGIPLCPTHHRMLDRGDLRLIPDILKWVSSAQYEFTVTRPDITHLGAMPHPDAVAWKWKQQSSLPATDAAD